MKRLIERLAPVVIAVLAVLGVALVLLEAMAPARAAEPTPFTSADLGRETAFFYLMLVDYHQTTTAFSYTGPGTYHERNPFIKHGYEGVYFIGGSVAHAYVASRLDPAARAGWQYGWIALELATVVHNKHVGLNYHF